MSFPYLEDFENDTGILFDDKTEEDNMNILIGANGSWKSNFIDIIRQFFDTIIFDFTFDAQSFEKEQKSDEKTMIHLLKKTTSWMMKHRWSSHLNSNFEITLDLYQNDYENIGFVCKYYREINEMIQKYSDLDLVFPKYSFYQIMEECTTLTIKSTFSEKEQMFTIDTTDLNEMEQFVLQCLQHQELFYILIKIHNDLEHKKAWYPIKNNFAIVSRERDNNELTYFNTFLEFDDYIYQDRTLNNPNMEGFYRWLDKIQTIINKNAQEIILQDSVEEDVEKRLYKSSFWKKISKAIKRFLNKTIFVEFIQDEISLKLKDEQGNFFFLSDLSSWEQSLLLIIFALYGNDLENGFMIIDEPELHIHPQLQKEFTLFLSQVTKEEGIQFFLSTYSALFINENNITNVYRFVNKNNNTQVYTPQMRIYSDDAKLVHILKYENISKIFFVDKIIMVEGDSDLYFFSHYLKWLQEQDWWEDIVGKWEIININGKGSYKAWHRFLNKFWIDNYFIWDWDNTVDYGFFTPKEINRFYQLANAHLEKYPKTNWDYYNKLVYTIKKYYPQKYKRIVEGIEDLYSDNIFILKLGAIESYPCLEKKGLQFMINFINKDFKNWLKHNKFQPQRKELIQIFSHIFHANSMHLTIWDKER